MLIKHVLRQTSSKPTASLIITMWTLHREFDWYQNGPLNFVMVAQAPVTPNVTDATPKQLKKIGFALD